MTENVTQPPVPQEDNLSDDLINMLRKAGLDHKQVNAVMLQLVPYVVERDHKILTHGYDAGRASA